MNKISVITIVKNQVNDIKKTIDSFANQKYDYKELIVVDGGSTDGTLEVIKSHEYNSNINLVSEQDEGIYDALNKGINRSTGDIIGILHSGDVFENPNVLSDIRIIFNSENVNFSYGDIIYVNNQKPVRLYSSKNYSKKLLRLGIIPAHPSLFIRREIIDKIGMYDPSYQIAGDFEYFIRIFSAYEDSSVYIPKILTLMKTGGKSSLGIKNQIIVNSEILRACRLNNVKTNLFLISIRYLYKIKEYFFRVY